VEVVRGVLPITKSSVIPACASVVDNCSELRTIIRTSSFPCEIRTRGNVLFLPAFGRANASGQTDRPEKPPFTDGAERFYTDTRGGSSVRTQPPSRPRHEFAVYRSVSAPPLHKSTTIL